METATMVTSSATWLPEDDILLKHAIEEGASLEALAKGAAHFSHKFSLQEVHDRWHALLYNPVISAQACAHLFRDETDRPKEIDTSCRKRKVGTLRKRYYARLKRVRNDFFSSPNLGLLSDSNLHSGTMDRSDYNEHGTLHDVPQVGLQKTDFDKLQPDFPLDLTDLAATNVVSNDGDVLHSEGPDPKVNNPISDIANSDCLRGLPTADLPFSVQGSLRVDELPPSLSNNIGCNDTISHSLQANSTCTWKGLLPGGELYNNNVYPMGLSPPLPSMPLWKSMEDITTSDMVMNMEESLPYEGSKGKRADKQNGDSFISSASISDGDFVDLPDSIFDFSNDDMFFMDVDGKDPLDKSCFIDTLSDMPIDMDEIDTLEILEKAMMVANTAIATKSDVDTSHLYTGLEEEQHASHVKVHMSPTSCNNKSLECDEGELYCVLNTEDPEIPCNDDIFLLIHPGSQCDAASAMTSSNLCSMEPISVEESNSVQELNSVKKIGGLPQSSKPSLTVGSYMLPETSQVHTGGELTARAESIDICKDLAFRRKAVADPAQCIPAQTSLTTQTILDKDVKKVDLGTVDNPLLLRELPLHAETCPVEVTHPKPVVSPSISEGPESEIDDPRFSDIEAMILDMDLGSYEDDLLFTRRVSKYQNENSMRTIIKLEQNARASIQRAMTSHGALAVLYDRHSRHFIRKTEVILGRSTEATSVDIELGKKGQNNSISRRQAIVKMEDDGSFSLKNLAKNTMLVNGAEVGTGKLVSLSSNCLIEIRGLSFVFESNQRYVRRYLFSKKNQGQMANFDWLPSENGTMS